MGGKKDAKGEQGWWYTQQQQQYQPRPRQEGHGKGGKWQPWRGAYGSYARSKADTTSTGGRYDQVQLKGDGKAQPSESAIAPASVQPVSLMQAIQKALTASRKADIKMRKLQESKDLKERQWTQ